MRKYIIYPSGGEDEFKSFVSSNPNLKDFEYLESNNSESMTQEILIRNKMTIDPDIEITKEEISNLISHRNLWWNVYDSKEPAIILDSRSILTSEYDEEKISLILDNHGLVDLSGDGNYYGGYAITPETAETLMATNLLESICPIQDYMNIMQRHFDLYTIKMIDFEKEKVHKLIKNDYAQERKHKIKYYILTSDNPEALERHISPEYSNIPKEDIIVVINTKDKNYLKYAENWCQKNNLEYHITESNGTPARGKNTLLDLFEESDNDFMVQIDGDDYITKHGVWLYEYMSRMDNPPDALCLKNQFSTTLDHDRVTELCRKRKVPIEMIPLSELPVKNEMYFTANWDVIENSDPSEYFIQNGCSAEKAKEYSKFHKEFYRLQKLYCEENESHCRVTWMSKNAVKSRRFPEHLVVGEDTIFYFLLKNDALLGNLDVRCNDERPATYIYDQRVPGTVHREVENGTNWTWMDKYNKEVRSLEKEGKVHSTDLPLFKVDYPEHYTSSAIGSEASSFSFKLGDSDGQLSAPANASDESLQKIFSWVYKYYK